LLSRGDSANRPAYRATAGIDIEHDQADHAAGHVLEMPVAVVQRDWGAALGYDAAGCC